MKYIYCIFQLMVFLNYKFSFLSNSYQTVHDVDDEFQGEIFDEFLFLSEQSVDLNKVK